MIHHEQNEQEQTLAWERVELAELVSDLTGGTLDAGQEACCREMIGQTEARIHALQEMPVPDAVIHTG